MNTQNALDTEHFYTNRSNGEGQTHRLLVKNIFQDNQNLGISEHGHENNQINDLQNKWTQPIGLNKSDLEQDNRM